MWVPYIYLSTGETWLLWHVPSVSGPYLDCGEQVVKACAVALRFFQWCRWEHVIPGSFPVHLLGMITEVEANTHYIDITGEVQGKRGCSNPLDAKRVPLNSFSKLSLWISWTLVEVDYSKQWWFQAFFIGSVNTLLPIKATQPHPATTAVYLVGFKLCVRWVHLCTSWCLVLNVFLAP